MNTTQTCTQCQKQFLIIEQEQKFITEKGLALPTHCPSCRQLRRLKLRGERALYRSKCAKCQKEIIVAFDPSKFPNQMILCRPDYDQYFVDHDPIIADPLPSA